MQSPASPPPPSPAYQMGQPASPQWGEMYCSSCGNIVKTEAEICVRCGVRLRRRSSSGEKSKVAAVLLAVFLGFWTWLYTYREDGAKFWVGFGVAFVNVILLFATLGLWVFVFWIPALGLWIWPVVDTASKNDEWYASY